MSQNEWADSPRERHEGKHSIRRDPVGRGSLEGCQDFPTLDKPPPLSSTGNRNSNAVGCNQASHSTVPRSMERGMGGGLFEFLAFWLLLICPREFWNSIRVDSFGFVYLCLLARRYCEEGRIEVEVCCWESGSRVVEFVEIVRSCKSWNEVY